MTNKSETDGALILAPRITLHPCPIKGYLKVRGRERSRNKDLRCHLGIEHGTSRTEGRALTNCAKSCSSRDTTEPNTCNTIPLPESDGKLLAYLSLTFVSFALHGHWSTPDPAIRSGDTGQRTAGFDSCQLITTLMCNQFSPGFPK